MKSLRKKPLIGTATWVAELNPLYTVECPHCGNIIIMSHPSTIKKLLRWAKGLIKK